MKKHLQKNSLGNPGNRSARRSNGGGHVEKPLQASADAAIETLVESPEASVDHIAQIFRIKSVAGNEDFYCALYSCTMRRGVGRTLLAIQLSVATAAGFDGRLELLLHYHPPYNADGSDSLNLPD